ncbi:MAG: flagellar basal body-associated FliL family protein [Pseudomonadota bacterium]
MMRLLIFLVIPLLLIAVTVGTLVFLGPLRPVYDWAMEKVMGVSVVDLFSPATEVTFVEIPEMLVNLRSDDGSRHYMKLLVDLEIVDGADVVAIEQLVPRIQDGFQSYLRSQTIKDLEGSAGWYRMREELLYRANLMVAPLQIRSILIKEMITQ